MATKKADEKSKIETTRAAPPEATDAMSGWGDERVTLTRVVKVAPEGHTTYRYGPGELGADVPASHVALIKSAFPDAIAEK